MYVCSLHYERFADMIVVLIVVQYIQVGYGMSGFRCVHRDYAYELPCEKSDV